MSQGCLLAPWLQLRIQALVHQSEHAQPEMSVKALSLPCITSQPHWGGCRPAMLQGKGTGHQSSQLSFPAARRVLRLLKPTLGPCSSFLGVALLTSRPSPLHTDLTPLPFPWSFRGVKVQLSQQRTCSSPVPAPRCLQLHRPAGATD